MFSMIIYERWSDGEVSTIIPFSKILEYNKKVNNKTMKKIFFSLVFLYGVIGSTYVAYETMRDMALLESAVVNGERHAEMRHRTNVAAEGTWFLLGNLIAIAGVFGMCQKK